MAQQQPPFGEYVVSWANIWRDRYHAEEFGDEYDPHDDNFATKMHAIRGIALGQASELESVLGEIIHILAPNVDFKKKTAGQRFKKVEELVDGDYWAYELDMISEAVKTRNRLAHDRIQIGSVWRDYATGGGEWVPVISFLGNQEYCESDLLKDLSKIQHATVVAVEILHFYFSKQSSQ